MTDKPPLLTVTLTSTLYNVTAGTQVILEWNVSNSGSGTTCFLSTDRNQSWYVGQGSPYLHQMTQIILQTITYTITVTDQFGQFASASVTIMVGSSPIGPAIVTPVLNVPVPSYFNAGLIYPPGVYSISYVDGAWFVPQLITATSGGGGTYSSGSSFHVNGCSWASKDVVIVMTNLTSATVSSITASGLTFTRISLVSQTTSGGVNHLEVWAATASGSLSAQTITINITGSPVFLSGGGNNEALQFAIQNTSLPQDNIATSTSSAVGGDFNTPTIIPNIAYTQVVHVVWDNHPLVPTGYSQVISGGQQNVFMGSYLENAFNIDTSVVPSVVVGSGLAGDPYPAMCVTMSFACVRLWYVGLDPTAHNDGYFSFYQLPGTSFRLAQTTASFTSYQAAVTANIGEYTAITVPSPGFSVAVEMQNQDITGVPGSIAPTWQLNAPISVNVSPVYQQVVAGNPATLSWMSNAAATTITPAPGAVIGTAGVATVFPTVSATYSLVGVSPGLTSQTAQAVINTTQLTAPVLTASPACGGQIVLSWTCAGPFSSFTLSRGTDNVTFVQIASGITNMFYKDTPPLANTQYYYQVVAVNNAATSAVSNGATARALVPPQSAPTATVLAYPGALTIASNIVDQAAGYRIYRGASPGGESAVATVTNPYYYDNMIAGSTVAWYYKISGFNQCGEGPLSSEVTGIPLAVAPPPVGGDPGTNYQTGAPGLTQSTTGGDPNTSYTTGGPPPTTFH